MFEINQDLIELLVRNLGDDQFVWTFQNDHPSPYLRSSIEFGDEDFNINLVDNFDGLQPILLNKDTINKDSQIPFRVTAILDSNVVSALVQFVSRNPPLTPSRHAIVNKFLHFLVEKKFDYNPMFYFMEGFWKDNPKDFPTFASQTSKAILTLHCMDTARFLESNEIVMDKRILAMYAEEYGVSSFEQIVEKHAKAMTIPTDWYSKFANKLSYACLLKMATIHKTSNKSIQSKFSELKQFMEGTIEIAMGTERVLSLGYFAGLYDDFIPLQRGANPDRILKRIQAASWDLFLLQMPVDCLARTGGEHGIILGYICTSDRTLTQVAKSYKLQLIMSGFTLNTGYIPILAYDYAFLYPYINREILDKLLAEDNEWQKKRTSRFSVKKEPISDDKLSSIVKYLEEQLSQICLS
jgi:hypothetical protein